MEDEHFARRCFLDWFAQNCAAEANNGVKTGTANCAQKAGKPFLRRPGVRTQPTSFVNRTPSLIRIVPGHINWRPLSFKAKGRRASSTAPSLLGFSASLSIANRCDVFFALRCDASRCLLRINRPSECLKQQCCPNLRLDCLTHKVRRDKGRHN